MMIKTMFVACLCGSALAAQMMKRHNERFADEVFAAARPAVGSLAPALELFDLDGRPRSLGLERGRSLVLIGGAYT